MAYHLFMKTREEFELELPGLQSERLRNGNRECFWGFKPDNHTNMTELGLIPYLGMILLDDAVKLIDDLNGLFKNMQIKVEFQKKFNEYANTGVHLLNYFPSLDKGRAELAETSSLFILTMEFSDKYSKTAPYHLFTPIIQFVRLLAPQYVYYGHFFNYWKQEPTVKNFLKINSEMTYRGGYGNWCIYAPTIEQFCKMDQPEIVNGLVKFMRPDSYYGSDLFQLIINKKPGVPVIPEEVEHIQLNEIPDEDEEEDQ